MHVFLLGVSHQTAPIDVREQLDFSSRDVGAAVEALATRYSAGEAVVLSTCNRSEIYVASDDPERARQELVDFLGSYHGLPRQAFEGHVFGPYLVIRTREPLQSQQSDPARSQKKMSGRLHRPTRSSPNADFVTLRPFRTWIHSHTRRR